LGSGAEPTPAHRELQLSPSRLLDVRAVGSCLDALIAAMAEVHGLTVVTRNARDFAHFDVPVFDPVAFAGHG